MEKRWLTKDEKRLLRPHAAHYSAMGNVVQDSSVEDLEKLKSACMACTTTNCSWQEYEAAQYLIGQIIAQIRWRKWRDAQAAELAEPTAHILSRLADDGSAHA